MCPYVAVCDRVRAPRGCRRVTDCGDTKVDGLPITYGCYSRPGNDPMKRSKENQVRVCRAVPAAPWWSVCVCVCVCVCVWCVC